MKYRLITYLLLVFIGTAICDFACRLIFTPIFQNQTSDTEIGANNKYISYKEPANLIILGDSRANHHYISALMEDSLDRTVYNYGFDGKCIFYQYLCLLRAIENGGLQTVLLDLSPAQISEERLEQEMSGLFLYYWYNDTAKTIVNEVQGRYYNIILASSLVQYNSEFLHLFSKIPNVKGYSPLPYTGKAIDTTKEVEVLNDNYYSENAKKYLQRIKKVCSDNHIRLIVCISPALNFHPETEKYLENLCLDYDIECWNKTHFISDPLLFRDLVHINEKGAFVYTQEIIRMLQEQ